MSRKIKAATAQKLNLMLSQAVTVMRVNEQLICRLLWWAAAERADPCRFIDKALEDVKNDLRQSADTRSTISTIALDEALEYLDGLATEIQAKVSTQKPKDAVPNNNRYVVERLDN